MNTELKKRKTVVGRKRSRPTETVKPEEVKILSSRVLLGLFCACKICTQMMEK